jgi:hypothetical protein
MRTNTLSLLVSALLVAGCGNGTNNGGDDLSTPPDLRQGGGDGGKPDGGGGADMAGVDMAKAIDMSPGPDLAMPDIVMLSDLAEPLDLSVPSDLAPGPDLVTLDSSIGDLPLAGDLAAADLAGLADAGIPGDLRTSDAAPPDLLMIPDGHMGCAPKVNELMSADSMTASDEFVEIYNPCQMDIDLTWWRLVYRPGNSTATIDPANDTNILVDGANGQWKGVTIPAGGYLVYGGASFPVNMRDGTISNGLAGATGAVAIRDPFGFVVDSVCYGACNVANAFIETMPAPAPPIVAPPGNSISRLPNGTDTNNNSADWKASMMITPKAANK